MNKDLRMMIIIVALIWIFVIYRLIAARKIKIPFKYGNKIAIYLLFLVPVVILLLKSFSIYTIIFGLLIMLASALFASIPSGFYEDGIILYGRLYTYKKMDSMDIEKNYIDCRLIFDYHKRTHVIVGKKEDEMSFRQLIAYYQDVKKSVNKK